MKIKLVHLVIAMFLSYQFSISQQFNPGVSANIATGNKNVDPSTGILNFTLPLISETQDGYNVDVSIVYSGQGVKPANCTSRVGGKGWSLNAGGIVTRSVKGITNDENDYKGILGNLNIGIGSQHPSFQEINAGLADAENDIFTASFGNNSINFIIEPQGNGYKVSPLKSTDIKIEALCSSSSEIQGWKITDIDGTIYIFKEKEYSLNNFDTYEEGYIKYEKTFPSSWHLSRIILPTKSQIHFSYSKCHTEEVYSESYKHIELGLSWIEKGRAVDPEGEVYGKIDIDALKLERSHKIQEANAMLDSYTMDLQRENTNKEVIDSATTSFYSDNIWRITKFYDAEIAKAELENMEFEQIQIDEMNELYENRFNVLGIPDFAGFREFLYYGNWEVGSLDENLEYERLIYNKSKIINNSHISPIILSSIDGDDFSIVFRHSKNKNTTYNLNKSESNEASHFTGVDLYDKSGNIKKSVKFNISWVLNNIIISSPCDEKELNYNFDYYSPINPSKNQTDFFGFPNGQTNDDFSETWYINRSGDVKSYLKDPAYSNFNRCIKTDHAVGSNLKSICFPNGGSLNFTYESNLNYDDENMQYYKWGGLRIKNITQKDGLGNEQVTTYKYEFDRPSNCNSQVFTVGLIPSFDLTFEKKLNYDNGSDKIIYSEATQKIPDLILNSGNSGVSYHCVEESTSGKGKTLYIYPPMSIMNHYREHFWADSYYPEIGSLLLAKYIFNENDELIFIEKFTYELDQNIYQKFKANWSPTSDYFKPIASPQSVLNIKYIDNPFKVDELRYYEENDINFPYKNQNTTIFRLPYIEFFINPFEFYIQNIKPRQNLSYIREDREYFIAKEQKMRLLEKENIVLDGVYLPDFNPLNTSHLNDDNYTSSIIKYNKEIYYYEHPDYNAPTRIDFIDNENKKVIKKFKYPFSYDLTFEGAENITLLKNFNMINSPIETQTWILDNGEYFLINSEILEYGTVEIAEIKYPVLSKKHLLTSSNRIKSGQSDIGFYDTIEKYNGFTSLFPLNNSNYRINTEFKYNNLKESIILSGIKNSSGIEENLFYDNITKKLILRTSGCPIEHIACRDFTQNLRGNFRDYLHVFPLFPYEMDFQNFYYISNIFLQKFENEISKSMLVFKYPWIETLYQLHYALFNDHNLPAIFNKSELFNSAYPNIEITEEDDPKHLIRSAIMVAECAKPWYLSTSDYSEYHQFYENYKYSKNLIQNGMDDVEKAVSIPLQIQADQLIKDTKEISFTCLIKQHETELMTSEVVQCKFYYRGIYSDGSKSNWTPFAFEVKANKWQLLSKDIDYTLIPNFENIKYIEVDDPRASGNASFFYNSGSSSNSIIKNAILHPKECSFEGISYNNSGNVEFTFNSNMQLFEYNYNSKNQIEEIKNDSEEILKSYFYSIGSETTPYLDFNTNRELLIHTEGQMELDVSSNTKYSIEIDECDWLSISYVAKECSGNTKLFLRWDRNEGCTPREHTINLNSLDGNITKSLTIKQLPQPFNVDTNDKSIFKEGGIVEIPFHSGCDDYTIYTSLNYTVTEKCIKLVIDELIDSPEKIIHEVVVRHDGLDYKIQIEQFNF